jgi:hypothetical protein
VPLLDLSAYGLEELDRTGHGRQYDVSPDGRRFVIVKPTKNSQPERPQIIVVQHVNQELDRMMAAK